MTEQNILMFEMFTLIFVNIIVLIAAIAFFRTVNSSNNNSEPEALPELPPPRKDMTMVLGNSKELMSFIQEVAKNMVAANFKNFLDEYEISKINKPLIEKLIEKTAQDIYKVIAPIKTINFIEEETLLSKDFYSEFIVILSTNYVKELVENNI